MSEYSTNPELGAGKSEQDIAEEERRKKRLCQGKVSSQGYRDRRKQRIKDLEAKVALREARTHQDTTRMETSTPSTQPGAQSQSHTSEVRYGLRDFSANIAQAMVDREHRGLIGMSIYNQQGESWVKLEDVKSLSPNQLHFYTFDGARMIDSKLGGQDQIWTGVDQTEDDLRVWDGITDHLANHGGAILVATTNQSAPLTDEECDAMVSKYKQGGIPLTDFHFFDWVSEVQASITASDLNTFDGQEKEDGTDEHAPTPSELSDASPTHEGLNPVFEQMMWLMTDEQFAFFEDQFTRLQSLL